MTTEKNSRESMRPRVPSLGAEAREAIRESFASWRRPSEDSNPTVDLHRKGGGVPSESLLTGEDWSHSSYILTDIIGRGAEGLVWTGVQLPLNREVAVKTVKEGRGKDKPEDPEDRWLRELRFYQEALITSRLDHPNIVSVHDIGLTDDGRPLLAMKLVRGTPWNELLQEDFDRLPVDDFLQKHLPIFIDMMQAVAYAHSKGIIHRDLKPSQVMLGDFGEVILLDWGMAVALDSQLFEVAHAPSMAPISASLPTRDTAPNPAGTPALMAPEQTRDDASGLSEKTDIYLLGGVLYFILTLTYPHDADDALSSIALAEKGHIQPPRSAAPTAPCRPNSSSSPCTPCASTPTTASHR